MAVTNFSAVSAALGPSLRRTDQNRYVYVKFDKGVPNGIQEVDGTAAVVTDAGVNTFTYQGHQFYYFVEQAFAGTAPQVIDRAGGGLFLVVDAADNDGIRLCLPYCTSAGEGTLKTAGPGIFTGRTDGFFIRASLTIADVSESDEIMVGVRKVAAFPAAVTADTDFAALNVDNGTIKLQTNLNSGTPSSTSSTQTVADTGSVILEVRVSEAGYAKFLINGAVPTVDVTGFQFDADALMPFISVVNDAAGTAGVQVNYWESGLLTERGLDGVNDLLN